jgi:hypothetical protein
MGISDDITMPRRIKPLIILIDTTLLSEDNTSLINNSIKSSIELLDENPDYEYRYNILIYSTESSWIYDKFVQVRINEWKDINRLDDDRINFYNVAMKLNEELSRKFFDHHMIGQIGGYHAPIIILAVKENPSENFEKGIKLLKNNNWFKSSLRIVLNFGEHTEILYKFTNLDKNTFDGCHYNSNKLVINVNNILDLDKYIKMSILDIEKIFPQKYYSDDNFDQSYIDNSIDRSLNELKKKWNII